MKNKTIGLIIAFKDFRDEEYFITKDVFEEKNIKTKTISKKKGKALSYFGGQADIDLKLTDVNIDDFDALVFVGGQGAKKYIENKNCHNLAKKALEKGKIVGAICIAPLILAAAGILKGKKATVWSSEENKEPEKELEKAGAKYQDKGTVIDENIVTASGPKKARKFAREIVSLLS